MEHNPTKEVEETAAPKEKVSSSDDEQMIMPDGKSMKMSDHKSMTMPGEKMSASGMAMDHGSTVWPHFANMILGVWLIASVLALG